MAKDNEDFNQEIKIWWTRPQSKPRKLIFSKLDHEEFEIKSLEEINVTNCESWKFSREKYETNSRSGLLSENKNFP